MTSYNSIKKMLKQKIPHMIIKSIKSGRLLSYLTRTCLYLASKQFDLEVVLLVL